MSTDLNPADRVVDERMERRSPGRSAAAGICLFLAVLFTVPSALAFWAHRTLTDTERYVATVGPLVDSPQVQSAIATMVTDAIDQQVDVEAVINDVFSGVITDRPRLARLVSPLSGAINGLIDRQVQEFVASQAFSDIWVTVNTLGQQRLVRLLEGNDTGAVSLQGDQVVLDVSDVIDQVKSRLVARGLTFAANAPVPNVDKQIVLMEAPRLRQARTIYAVVNPIATWLIVLVAALYVAAFAIARRRSRMAAAIGVALVANALLVALALPVGRQLFINDLAGTSFGPAAADFYDTLLVYLQRGWRVVAWLGVILVVAGWFTGSNATGTTVRTSVTGVLERAGATQSGGPTRNAGLWVAANVAWLRVVVGVLGAAVLLWGNDVSPSRLLWSTLVVGGLLVAIQVLVGVGRGAAPGTPPPAGSQLAT